jgi:ATP-dependent DNA helicase RecQ
MKQFAEALTCRRRMLLSYFNEYLPEDCGNCDVCLNKPDFFDATLQTQMALSAVYRMREQCSMNLLIDVLRGSENERILQSGHQAVSTYGIGQELSANEWKSVFRQLVANGYLRADPEGYGALQLTEDCRPLLKGDVPIELRKDPVQQPGKSRGTGGSGRGRKFADEVEDKDAWEALRACRKGLAEKKGVPPYVIFHDATLFEILEKQPASLSDMADITGVGAAKLEKYGDQFLAALKPFLRTR